MVGLHSHQILIVAVQKIACIKSAVVGLPMRQSGWLRLSSDRKTAEPSNQQKYFFGFSAPVTSLYALCLVLWTPACA
jgi:hypothetical protein